MTVGRYLTRVSPIGYTLGLRPGSGLPHSSAGREGVRMRIRAKEIRRRRKVEEEALRAKIKAAKKRTHQPAAARTRTRKKTTV